MKVNFYATLRQVVGEKTADFPLAEGGTVRQLVGEIVHRYPELCSELLDKEGNLQRRIHVLVNGRDSSFLQNALETVLAPDDKVDIFPPVGGG